MKRIVVKSPVEKMRARADAKFAFVEELASEHLMKLAKDGPDGDKGWDEVTVRDKLAFTFGQFHASRSRAHINADAGPKVLGVVMIPQRISDKAAWEARAREIETQGRKIIDTTAGPVLIGKGDE